MGLPQQQVRAILNELHSHNLVQRQTARKDDGKAMKAKDKVREDEKAKKGKASENQWWFINLRHFVRVVKYVILSPRTPPRL